MLAWDVPNRTLKGVLFSSVKKYKTALSTPDEWSSFLLMQVERSLKELKAHPWGLFLHTASKLLSLHESIGFHIQHSHLFTLDIFLFSLKVMFKIIMTTLRPLCYWEKSWERSTSPSPTVQVVPKQGRQKKRLLPWRSNKIPQMFCWEKEYFIAWSVGISVIGRTVNLIQKYVPIYNEMKGWSLLPVNLAATTLLIWTMKYKQWAPYWVRQLARLSSWLLGIFPGNFPLCRSSSPSLLGHEHNATGERPGTGSGKPWGLTGKFKTEALLGVPLSRPQTKLLLLQFPRCFPPVLSTMGSLWLPSLLGKKKCPKGESPEAGEIPGLG